LVRRLVELHGGTITATSTGRGKGTEFVARLPALSAEKASSNGSRKHEGEQPALPAAKAPPRRILIVDDNVDGAKTLGMLLSRDGHDVRVAFDGLSALKIAEESPLDVVLLDIGLPRMDGYEVARRLGQRAQMQNALLVAVTGYGQDGDRRTSQEAGFHAHLIKPVDLSALRAVLLRCPAPVQSRAGT
jgi:CheY-like chemotaxis protein